jgi:hypothetical protein
MSETLFEVDLSDLKSFERFLRKAPRAFARATGSLLNEFAFGTRVEAFYEIASKMTARNPRFIASRIQVTKASKSAPISSQVSIVGSVPTDRFSGWTEQQFGKSTARKRVINMLARMGNIKRQAIPKARLKPGVDILNYADIRLKGPSSPERQSLVMLQMLARAHSREPFLLTRKSGMTPGLYRFQGGKPKLLQTFEKKQPHKIPWITYARVRYFREHDIQALWAKSLGYAFKGEGPKK